MNLNPPEVQPGPDPSSIVSIPIRDLMNLNHTETLGMRGFKEVSIPIRDLMNLNLLLFFMLIFYAAFQSLLGI